MTLGNRIREARITQQLTQKDVVGDFMTRNMLSKIENGSATPSVKTLKFLADALSLPVSYFVEDSGADGGVSSPPPVFFEQLKEIGHLADKLREGGDVPSLALCVKARALLAGGEAAKAKSLLENAESLDSDGRRHIYTVLEDCCKALDDYKTAYEYACKRMEV